jgi:hypothetical protein
LSIGKNDELFPKMRDYNGHFDLGRLQEQIAFNYKNVEMCQNAQK